MNPGCRELLAWLKQRGMPTALITRNSRQSVEVVLARHALGFDALVTREEDRQTHPHPLRLACRKLAISETEVWMVGDGSFDIQASAAAGIKTVWLATVEPDHSMPSPGTRFATCVICTACSWR